VLASPLASIYSTTSSLTEQRTSVFWREVACSSVYAQGGPSRTGINANVLFFDHKPAAEKPWTDKLWIDDLRTNKHFTLKENPLKRSDLDDFVAY
jgi:hypothetical protein